MTAPTHAQPAHGHGHGHDDDHDEGVPHFSLRDYSIGFIASIVLTAIPFWLVMGGVIESSRTTAIVLLAFAAVQIVVHMVCFLHMNTRSEGGWNMLALVFTLVLVVITLGGSLWIMHHLNVNMMPGHATHAWQQEAEDGQGGAQGHEGHQGHDAHGGHAHDAPAEPDATALP